LRLIINPNAVPSKGKLEVPKLQKFLSAKEPSQDCFIDSKEDDEFFSMTKTDSLQV